MNRAILSLTHKELVEITKRISTNNYDNRYSLLENKLRTALISFSDEDKVAEADERRLELNEDDLEYILDEFIMPTVADSDESRSVRNKIQKIITSFRSQQ